LDSTGSGQVPVAGCCECGNEPRATELVSKHINVEIIGNYIFHSAYIKILNVVFPISACELHNQPIVTSTVIIQKKPLSHVVHIMKIVNEI
jgi:hypothetical protein